MDLTSQTRFWNWLKHLVRVIVESERELLLRFLDEDKARGSFVDNLGEIWLRVAIFTSSVSVFCCGFRRGEWQRRTEKQETLLKSSERKRQSYAFWFIYYVARYIEIERSREGAGGVLGFCLLGQLAALLEFEFYFLENDARTRGFCAPPDY